MKGGHGTGTAQRQKRHFKNFLFFVNENLKRFFYDALKFCLKGVPAVLPLPAVACRCSYFTTIPLLFRSLLIY